MSEEPGNSSVDVVTPQEYDRISGHPKWQDLPPLHGNFRHLSRPQRMFLLAYVEFGNVSAAARCAGIDRDNHYVWLRDPAYAESFAAADEMCTDKLVHEAHRLAVEGVAETITRADGSIVTKYRHATDIFLRLLEARDPKRFARRLDVKHGGTVEHAHTVTLDERLLAALSGQELLVVEAAARVIEEATARLTEARALPAPQAETAGVDR